ncbi:heterokaryon incompatibility protein-domain-containing protein [Lophiotrema nucula]|uniref:Heterokaryon incompatibility protein-domain-containing protein n=1 Tax=Lophiotrema nucula TaxID=690887 RepID=A0A6A5YNK8_9PLEO|nr:heterokaryon incompatibility protein-domain-containing protein [Lophiotrema nucula]
MSKAGPPFLPASPGQAQNHNQKKLICSRCTDIFIRPGSSVEEKIQIQLLYRDIVSTAKDGCTICLRAWGHFLRDSNRRKFHISDEDPFSVSFGLGEYDNSPVSVDHGTARLIFRREVENGDEYPRPLCHIKFKELRSRFDNPHIETHCRKKGKTLIPVLTTAPAKNTAHLSCFDLIDTWLRNCFQNHPLCRQSFSPQQGQFVPTRLIDVTNTGFPRLIVTNGQGIVSEKIDKYVTVSHRWSTEETLKLLRENLTQLECGIDICTLPQVFRDAFTVATRLGVRFVWIDALCIVQDDYRDWEREASVMGEVYRHAFCNIGAVAASEGSAGLFVERDTRLVSSPCIQIERQDLSGAKKTFLPIISQHGSSFTQLILLRRGWVLQERLLSPRSIYFGQDLGWECSELQASETYPEGQGHSFSSTPWGDGATPFRLANLFHKESLVEVSDGPLREAHRRWLFIAQGFSETVLTYKDDVFPAISGLAHSMKDIVADVYIAGLWKNDLVRGLLWEVPRGDTSSRDYIAPSWSWASSGGRVYFPLVQQYTSSATEVNVVEVNAVHTTLAGPDPMGKVTDGLIHITGHLQQSRRRFRSPSPSEYRWRYADNFYDDNSSTCGGEAKTYQETFHFLLCYQQIEYHPQKGIFLLGLIIEPTGRTKDEYRRVGMFCHPAETGDPRDAEEFPEFAELDLKNFERTTITII